ncbi:MAG: ABC transporter ATP-binding protein, partial [Leptolyngbya sp. SIO3F4]|nr:ABC transporter ATP-binding protein [Leptolyngbya sp. SIO3F4]
VWVNGRVAPLIALGAGFNPVLTGRENIYANMSILGLTREEIDARFDEVVAFAEIADAIDAPVRSYSSGMQARLGFSCAIHTNPEIILIDEVLAVGDVRFRAKCHRKLSELRNCGTAFVLVTHNAQTILNVCEKAVYLASGKLIATGETDDVMRQYEKDLFQDAAQETKGFLELPDKLRSESTGVDIKSIFFRDQEGQVIHKPLMGKPATLCITCRVFQSIKEVKVGFAIAEVGGDGGPILVITSAHDATRFNLSSGLIEFQINFQYVGLIPNMYSMQLYIKQGNLHTLDFVENFRFYIDSSNSVGRSKFYQPRTWDLIQRQKI